MYYMYYLYVYQMINVSVNLFAKMYFYNTWENSYISWFSECKWHMPMFLIRYILQRVYLI